MSLFLAASKQDNDVFRVSYKFLFLLHTDKSGKLYFSCTKDNGDGGDSQFQQFIIIINDCIDGIFIDQ